MARLIGSTPQTDRSASPTSRRETTGIHALVLGRDSFHFDQIASHSGDFRGESRESVGVIAADGSYSFEATFRFAGETGAAPMAAPRSDGGTSPDGASIVVGQRFPRSRGRQASAAAGCGPTGWTGAGRAGTSISPRGGRDLGRVGARHAGRLRGDRARRRRRRARVVRAAAGVLRPRLRSAPARRRGAARVGARPAAGVAAHVLARRAGGSAHLPGARLRALRRAHRQARGTRPTARAVAGRRRASRPSADAPSSPERRRAWPAGR